MRHDNFIPDSRLTAIRSRGYIPHWQVDHAIFFVTFRLADSLPASVVLHLKREREQMLRSALTAVERARVDAAFVVRLDHELDANHGRCLLRDHAETIAGALRHFDGERYDLHSWCVMPNHVHVMVQPREGVPLSKVLHSWKSYTAHVIGQGPIWQREYFDRVVRTPSEYAATKAYIEANPAKAGMKNWPWVS